MPGKLPGNINHSAKRRFLAAVWPCYIAQSVELPLIKSGRRADFRAQISNSLLWLMLIGKFIGSLGTISYTAESIQRAKNQKEVLCGKLKSPQAKKNETAFN